MQEEEDGESSHYKTVKDYTYKKAASAYEDINSMCDYYGLEPLCTGDVDTFAGLFVVSMYRKGAKN